MHSNPPLPHATATTPPPAETQRHPLPHAEVTEAPHRRGASGLFVRRLAITFVLVGLLASGATAFNLFGGRGGASRSDQGHASAAEDKSHGGDGTKIVHPVKVITPRRDDGANVVFERIATIEPYYRADLRARAAGIVKSVSAEIGEFVRRNDVLVEIDVAEWEQDVAQKRASVTQREKELKVSEAKHRDAEAARGVTAATIRQKEAELQAITATRDLKKRRYDRYVELSKRGSVTGSVVEEEERDLLNSEAALLAAKANVDRAVADHAESASKLEAAAADIELRQAAIDVAKADFERAKVVANYGKVIAPFDGVIVRRNVDPGSFIQNATTGTSESLISISRIDLVTVAAQFPDNCAPYLAADVTAVIKVSDIPGLTVTTRISRFSPNIQPTDRTVRVEIDLFNGGPREFREFERLFQASDSEGSQGLDRSLKQKQKPLPAVAFEDDNRVVRSLIPGMNASIKLAIGGADKAFMVPSSVVYSRSGTKFVLVVEDGKTRQIPVQVHMNDGQKARISLIVRENSAAGTVVEKLTGLTGDERIVFSNQIQIGNDAEVRAVAAEW